MIKMSSNGIVTMTTRDTGANDTRANLGHASVLCNGIPCRVDERHMCSEGRKISRLLLQGKKVKVLSFYGGLRVIQ